MSFALEHEIVTLAWIDNASVQFPHNIYATKRLIRSGWCNSVFDRDGSKAALSRRDI